MLRVGCAHLQTTSCNGLALRYTECSLCSAAAYCELMGFTCMLAVECTSVHHGALECNPCRTGYQSSLPISRQVCGTCSTSCRPAATLYVFSWSRWSALPVASSHNTSLRPAAWPPGRCWRLAEAQNFRRSHCRHMQTHGGCFSTLRACCRQDGVI